MLIQFTKMNGAGNDFLLIDNRDGAVELSPAQVTRICHRHRGVGADGLFLLVPNRTGDADWSWEFFNSDGSVADMCGNGARCFARFIQKAAGVNGRTTFRTGAGVIAAEFSGESVTVNLTPPKDFRLNQTLKVSWGEAVVHSVNTGVPHAVLFVPDADQAMVGSQGAELRRHPAFGPQGTNVNFVQVLAPNFIRVRTYERGVEGETLACGTGLTAAALVSARLHSFRSPVRVRTQGEDLLEVAFEEGAEFSNVRLTGPAEFVFEGVIEV